MILTPGGEDLLTSAGLLLIMGSRAEGTRLRRRVVMDTHLLGPVLGCLKMTTIDHQHHVETGDTPGIAGMTEFL